MNNSKTKKIIRIALLICLIFIGSFITLACTDNDAYIKYQFDTDTKTFTVVGCMSAPGDKVIIPEEYQGYTVAAIADQAFKDTYISSVTLPSTITSIGSNAFYGCKLLTSVYGLENCLSLKEIKYGTFRGCISLKNIKLPPNLIEIEPEAFWTCRSIENIELPNSLQTIGRYAFIACDSLSQIYLPDSVINIGIGAFAQCHSLKEVMLPPNLSARFFGVFLYCSSLTDIYVADNSQNFTSIDGILFDKNSTRIYCYPSGKTSEFYTIPSNVYTIEIKAFAYNSHLREITIPQSVSMIYDGIFESSENLTKINYEGTVKEWQSITKDANWNDNSADYTIYCTDGQIAKDGTVTYK